MTISTIWSSSECFGGYPLSALPESVVKSFQTQPTMLLPETDLLRLQCFSELTGDSLKEGDLSSGRTPEFLRDFVSAHYSPRFIKVWQPWVAALRLRRKFEISFPTMSFPVFACTHNRDSWPADFTRSVDSFALRQLVDDRVRFWRGWSVTDAAGHVGHLRFWRFHLRYGESRTNELYAAIREAALLQRGAVALPTVSAFADWMAAYPIDIDYHDPLQVGRALSEFFHHYIHGRHESGSRLATLVNQWRTFVLSMQQHLLGHAWARPLPAMPMPRRTQALAETLNLRVTANGTVRQSLVTPIPLQVTDAEAKELLFRDIEREVDVVLAWARVEVEQARLRLERRLRLAPTGIVTRHLALGEWNGQRNRLSAACSDRLAHAAATFEAVGFNHLKRRKTALLYPSPIEEITWELGIPTPGLLLAHGAVLVAKHPAITSSFLASLELYDRDGQQIGLQETDSGWYLIGIKRRRGPRLAQQQVLLDKESLDVVRDVIALTQPLRAWLRAKGDDRWRRLFLVTSGLGYAPRDWAPVKDRHSEQRWMASRLSHTLALSPGEASDLAARFSLKRLRSSAAVLVYLRTGSVQRMAEALGHAQCGPRLLDHYLPKPLQEFFTERWLRIFQTQILVEALKDSPHILEAASFESMSELDEFLENHALRAIPSHLEDPDGIGAEVTGDLTPRIVVCVELGILTMLLSLEGAVRRARRPPCGRAIRWARVAERLVPYLEAQTERPEFRAIVAEAKQYANPNRVENLIYG